MVSDNHLDSLVEHGQQLIAAISDERSFDVPPERATSFFKKLRDSIQQAGRLLERQRIKPEDRETWQEMAPLLRSGLTEVMRIVDVLEGYLHSRESDAIPQANRHLSQARRYFQQAEAIGGGSASMRSALDAVTQSLIDSTHDIVAVHSFAEGTVAREVDF